LLQPLKDVIRMEVMRMGGNQDSIILL